MSRKELPHYKPETQGSFVLLGTMEGGCGEEALLHSVFRNYRVSGEWFLYDPKEKEIDEKPIAADKKPLLYKPGEHMSLARVINKIITEDIDISDFTETRQRIVDSLREHPHLSDGKIAEMNGVSRQTVFLTKKAYLDVFAQMEAENKGDEL